MTGIIFDFNGTMVFDGHLHEKAWVEMIKKHNNQVSKEEVIAYIHGRTNDQVVGHFIGEVTQEEFQKLSDEKELEYQRLVKEEQITFIEGTEELLDELVTRDIPFTIATASPKINVDFYFDYFELSRWFAWEDIVYDDGTFPGKPDPTIYKIAAENLGFNPKECVVIEDAVAGIESANRAKIGQVFAMVNSKKQKDYYEESTLKIEAIIDNFDNFLEKIGN